MLEIRGEVSRRGFMTLGGLGLAGLTAGRLAQARAGSPSTNTAVILFWMAGGPSHLDTYDMKPAAPAEIRGPFRAVQTRLPGLRVNELMPGHARIAPRLSLVRSLHHSLPVHDDASHWVQTGYPLVNARQRGQVNPSQGSVIARLRGPNQKGMPPYVCIPEAYSSPRGFYQRSAYLGSRHDPLNAGGDPSLGNYRTPDFSLSADVTLPRLESRRELIRQIDGAMRNLESRADMHSLGEMQQEAFTLLAGKKIREAFDVSREPLALRERYGRHAYGQSALLARRMVEAGVTFVTINLYEADVDWWDDHTHIEKNLRQRLPRFDQALATLIDDLADRGLANRVLVAAFGEFGRTPRINTAGAGRDHWPRAMTALLSGGGIQGGRIIGGTTSDGGEPRDRPLVPGNLLASIYRVVGIDPETTFLDRQNRPVRLVEAGRPIDELF
ncbi:MAG: DUF1501 domain-containing protein [Gemmataceae bacterium]